MSEKRKIAPSLQLSFCEIVDVNNGITEIRFGQKYTIDTKEMLQIQEGVSGFTNTHPAYLLVIPGPEGTVTTAAKELPFGNKEDKYQIECIAIITKLLHQRLLGNLYFKFKREKITRYQLFRNKKNAIKWLEAQISN